MVVFTDLDGTLLDRDTYSYAPAEPAIAHLREQGIPLIMVTSKTRAEVETLRTQMGNTDPYIVENGGAVVIPGRRSLVQGSGIGAAREALRQASATSGVRVRGFGDMATADIVELSGLAPALAELAAQREYGEPFIVLDGEIGALAVALDELGFQVTRGGRFFHVLGGCDKARAVVVLSKLLGDRDTVGLGEAPNDIGFLLSVRTAVIVPSPYLDAMRAALPAAVIAPESGPAGWNHAMMALLQRRNFRRTGTEARGSLMNVPKVPGQ
jgi:mannosyl-3-phosphoglycerate phosphatase